MNADTGIRAKGVKSSQHKSRAAVISEIFGGYIIGPGDRARMRGEAGEIAAIVGCMMFGVVAYGQWLWPGQAVEADLLPFKIASTIVLFIFAFAFYLIARRGLLYEVQVDKKRKELRTARRNREGVSSMIERIPFAGIEKVYMQRVNSRFVPSTIYVQPYGRSRPIRVALGPRDQMEPLLQRLIADLSGAAARDARAAKGGNDAPFQATRRGFLATG